MNYHSGTFKDHETPPGYHKDICEWPVRWQRRTDGKLIYSTCGNKAKYHINYGTGCANVCGIHKNKMERRRAKVTTLNQETIT